MFTKTKVTKEQNKNKKVENIRKQDNQMCNTNTNNMYYSVIRPTIQI